MEFIRGPLKKVIQKLSINFNIITPVWGQEHINFYFKYTFKSYF